MLRGQEHIMFNLPRLEGAAAQQVRTALAAGRAQ
jgi:hypothetical protein